MTIVARVRRTIRERGLVAPARRVLVACSGGPDSAALLYALARLGPELRLDLVAASVDHGLRANAGHDVELARAQAARVGVPFRALAVRVAEQGSRQAAARDARYAGLRSLARELGSERIAVGHTREDQAETVLARLLRGASVLGLSGIAPRRRDGVIRPLIDCSRDAARAFAASMGPALARDPGNDDPRFLRTRVRSRALPVFQAESPDFALRLCALADDARALAVALAPAARALLDRSGQSHEIIDVSSWGAEPEALRRLALRRAFKRAGIALGRAHLVQLDAAILARRGEVWLPQRVVARVSEAGILRVAGRETT